MNNLKKHLILLLCFGISLTERFTQAAIPLIVNYLSLTSIEMSLLLSAMAASTVFTSLLIAPYIDAFNQKMYSGFTYLFAGVATLSFLMFSITASLEWGCFLMFCIGVILRIINLRRLSVINSEINTGGLSHVHTRMQLSITIAMAVAPLCLALTTPDNYLNLAVAMMLSCVAISLCTSQIASTAKTLTLVTTKQNNSNSSELVSANFFIFVGMIISGLFLSVLFIYCQSVSDQPVQLYARVIFSQVIGLIAANILFERFFGARFNWYSILIISIVLSELIFIFTKSGLVINVLSCMIGFSFQIMFLRSHNQFQSKIPRNLTAKLNGVRGLYTFAGVTTGYILGPFLHKIGGVELVFLTCSAIALLFFLFLKHLSPQNSNLYMRK